MRDHEWLKSQCERTVVVAHSAGSAVTHQLIRDGRIKDVQTYVTLGEAIWRMQWMRSLSKSGQQRIVALALAVVGFALWVVAIVVAVNRQPLWWTLVLLAASGCVHAISVRVVWRTGDADEARRTAIENLCGGEHPKVRLWRDYIGSSDPVPGGALTDTARATQRGAQAAAVPQSADAGRYEPVWIRNRRSMLLDHTAYPDNLEEYVAGLGMDLVAASLPDEPPPTLIDAVTAARAQIARALRTLSMSMARLGCAAVAVAVLFALTLDDSAGLQRLGAGGG